MGIQRYGHGRTYGPHDQGTYVLFTDHEHVVAELSRQLEDTAYAAVLLQDSVDRLRAELAAKSKDAERYQWLRQLDNAFDFRKLPRTWSAAHTPEQLDDTIDAAMGEANGR